MLIAGWVCWCQCPPESHRPVLLVLGGVSAACGHCREVVYPTFTALRNHDALCVSGVVTWYSRDLEIEVHKCEQPSAEVNISELMDLTAPVGV